MDGYERVWTSDNQISKCSRGGAERMSREWQEKSAIDHYIAMSYTKKNRKEMLYNENDEGQLSDAQLLSKYR